MGKSESGSQEQRSSLVADHPFLQRVEPGESHLLCVSEDPRSTTQDLVPQLKAAGYNVDLFHAEQSLAIDLSSKPYRLLLIDIGAADGSGYQTCERMRFKSGLPIVLVLRGVARYDVLRGYQAGADAYVVAPFDFRELIGRMKAVTRRQPVSRQPA